MADIININEVVVVDIINMDGVLAEDIVSVDGNLLVLGPPEIICTSGCPMSLDNIGTDTVNASIDVNPNSMNTTLSKIDTGDGTGWFEIDSGATETGDFTLTVINFGTPPGTNVSAAVDIVDDAAAASTLRVLVHYSHFI